MIRRRLLSSFTCSNYRLPQTISQLLAQRIESSDVQQSQQPVTTTVSGWIKSIRRQKNLSFAVLTDGSSQKGLQAVFIGAGKDCEDVKRLTNGSAVKLTGKLVSSPGKGQDKELVVELGSNNTLGRVELLGECPHDTYPIQKQALSNEYLRDNAHLRARTDRIASMVRLRSALKRNISAWLEVQGFHQVHTPILTGNDAEGAGEAFRIAPMLGEHPAALAAVASSSSTAPMHTVPPTPTEFFSRPAYLTVSHQLHLEALASALSRVYSLSPCFRAEPSLTARHLAEFWMLEAEWAFSASDVEEICEFVEAMLRSVVGGVLESSGTPDHPSVWEDISFLWKQNGNNGEEKLASLQDAITSRAKWTRLNYAEAIKELRNYHNSYTLSGSSSGSTKKSKLRFHFEPNYSNGLQSEHERWLSEDLIGGPVFITDYPSSIKPFYMRLNGPSGSPTKTEEEGSETVACFDLLIPHLGELAGGSVREERLDVLSRRMDQAGLGGQEYEWYKDLRRYGGVPHGGFGIGFERLVGWVGGIENVRECVPMPRWPGRMLL